MVDAMDRDGVKTVLPKGAIGYDDYAPGGDVGRIYIGTGTVNIPLAKKDDEATLGTPIASAATVTIGTSGLGDYIHITGTTTITSFGAAASAGIRRTLIFDGALTLTHNATSLICVGGISIVTVAGMVIEVVAETTANWRVVSITHPSISATEMGYLDGVTSAVQTQIDTKAPLASPTFTGIPLAPTATTGTSTTQLATTAFTSNAILATVAVYAESPSYGLEWNETTDTYTRVGDSDYTRIQRKFRRCVINADAEVVYYLHPHNSLLKEDGTLADLSGADGNVMVEVPLTYLKYTYTTGTVKHKWEISDKADDGFEPHSCFVIAGEVKKYRYFPAYNGTVVNNKLMSISGTYATVGTSRTALRPLARANGATFCQQDWLLTEFISLMALIEYGTMNIQTGLGAGRSALTGGSWVGGSLIALNGLSNSLGNNSGNYTYTGSVDDAAAALSFMSYRGCENFYGNVWKWLDGINISERVPYVCQNPSEFADDKYSGGYVSTGVTMAVSSGSYGRTLGNSSKGFFVTDVSGGTSTVGTTDGLWTNTGSMALRFGNVANTGAVDGAFCLNAGAVASAVSVAIGGGVAAWSKD